MTSRRGKRRHTRFTHGYELPKPRTPLSCNECGAPVECAKEETLKAFMNHDCREKK